MASGNNATPHGHIGNKVCAPLWRAQAPLEGEVRGEGADGGLLPRGLGLERQQSCLHCTQLSWWVVVGTSSGPCRSTGTHTGIRVE